MDLLGLGGLDHNGSITHIIDGEVRSFLEAERVTREKNVGLTSQGHIEQVLEALDVQEVDRIAIADNTFWQANQAWLPPFLLGRFGDVPIDVWSHHVCHATAAYAGSNLQRATCVTIDGKGDGLSAAAFLFERNHLEPFLRVSSRSSIGRLWWAVAEFCGLPGHHSAGKVMALAAYGSPQPLWDEALHLHEDGGFELKPLGHPDTFREVPRIVDWLRETLGVEGGEPSPDVAASVQDLTERVVIHLVERCVARTGVADVCLAGGVALNGLVNQRLLDQGVARSLHVPPCTDDRGLSLGAAVRSAMEHGGHVPRLSTPFLGPHPRTSHPGKAWSLRSTDADGRVAALIAAGEIVATCHGRDEAGPRALGHRSLLATPTDPGMRDRLNVRVKRRETFRPFGIAILEPEAPRWLQLTDSSPFMLRIARVRDDARGQIPAAVHVDGTTRVQTVSHADGSGLAGTLEALLRLGHPPLVINTSLNQRGEPLVHDVHGAAASCAAMGIRWLWTDQGLFEHVPPER